MEGGGTVNPVSSGHPGSVPGGGTILPVYANWLEANCLENRGGFKSLWVQILPLALTIFKKYKYK